MAVLTPRFSANRTVREYTEKYYLPAAASYLERAGEKGAAGVKIASTYYSLSNHWQNIRFIEVKVESREDHHLFLVRLLLD